MRPLFLLCLALAACSADPVLLPDAGPCSSACGAGTVCSGGACVAADAGGADVLAVDVVGEDRGAVDAGADVAVVDAPAVDVVDAGAADAGVDVASVDVSCNADAGIYACGGVCRDLVHDSMNCGRCGDVCTGPATCMAAQCIDPQTDPMNCGGLGTQCHIANGTAGCVVGVCTVGSCRAPFANCDGNVANGCEVDTLHSATHCGGCGRPCGTGQSCEDGACR